MSGPEILVHPEGAPLQTGLFPFHAVTRSQDQQMGTQYGVDRGWTLETELVALHMVHTCHRNHHPVIRHLDELFPPEIPQRELRLVDRAAEEIGDYPKRQARTVGLGAADVVESLQQLTTQLALVLRPSLRGLSHGGLAPVGR